MPRLFDCMGCGKSFKSAAGLSKHYSTCATSSTTIAGLLEDAIESMNVEPRGVPGHISEVQNDLVLQMLRFFPHCDSMSIVMTGPTTNPYFFLE